MRSATIKGNDETELSLHQAHENTLTRFVYQASNISMVHSIIRKLIPGDMRTTGKADEVAKQLLKAPSLVEVVLGGIESDDPGLRMRSADALEKAAQENTQIIQLHKGKLIKIAQKATQQEVQWHMAQILSYLDLSGAQEVKAKDILFKYLKITSSGIVKTFSIQALFEISQRNQQLKATILRRIHREYQNGSPAVRKRVEILIPTLSSGSSSIAAAG